MERPRGGVSSCVSRPKDPQEVKRTPSLVPLKNRVTSVPVLPAFLLGCFECSVTGAVGTLLEEN